MVSCDPDLRTLSSFSFVTSRSGVVVGETEGVGVGVDGGLEDP